jgi:HEAT repeat protein
LARLPAKAIPELLRFLDTKRDLGVRLGAVTTIGTLGVEEQQLAEVLKGLNELLDDPQSVVRLQVVQVLATFGPLAKSAIPKLVGRQLLGDVTSWEMRQAVVATLGQVGLARERVGRAGSPGGASLGRCPARPSLAGARGGHAGSD